MSTSTARDTLRAIVVLGLATLVLTQSLPDIRRVWQPLGEFGVAGIDPNQVITGIDDDTPASRAGLAVGDRILVALTVPDRRYWVVAGTGPETPLPGQQLTLAVKRGDQQRFVTMVSEPEPLTITTKALLVARLLALLLFVGIGAGLVLLRPSIATWAFFFVCLGLNGAPAQVTGISVGLPWNYLLGVLGASGFLSAAGLVGVVVFAAQFLHEGSGGWRAAVNRVAPFAFVILACMSLYWWIVVGYFGAPGRSVANLYLAMEGLAVTAAVLAFIATYVSARGSERQRIRWIVWGFGIALIATLVVNFLTTYVAIPYWLYASLMFVPIVVPLTVGYAVIKHRVIDVSFVVSRAIVYGVLTTLLLCAFSLVDWLFIEKLKLARFGTIAEMAVAVAGGLWFRSLHTRVDQFTDAIFFRQRHRAEIQLARDAKVLPLAESLDTVAHFLVDEPVRALALASAALFRRGRDGVFAREPSHGWDDDRLAALDSSDEPLLLLARTENGPLSLYDHPWRSDDVPSGAKRPVLALPIIVRRELAAIVFYGSHLHGESLDPDEIRAIGGLATGAAAAYDHLEAEAMQTQVSLLQSTVKTMQAMLAEAQIQPT